MRVDDFDYELPEELVAQEPAAERTAARLLVHELGANRTVHGSVAELATYLRAGDLLVANDTRVRPLRLRGRRETGGAVEVLLVERLGREELGGTWRALVQPARKLRAGERVRLVGANESESGALVMVERRELETGELDPAWVVRFEGELRDAELIERLGRMPLPPYIRRDRDDDPRHALDRVRYQPVFARTEGAVAAPTAGLHFTDALLGELEAAGIERATVTLHVGEGTFRPVKVERIEDHRMHAEELVLGDDVVRAVAETRARGGRVVALGTTSARVLESCVTDAGELEARSGSTRLFLHPGRELRVVDALFTNFHLPRSTLLMLVSAFAGRERVLELYREAVERRYRFFSYGDAMLLLP